MLASRKPLAIALVLVVLSAMLAPAATAVPERTHGVDITYPTQAGPAYVNPLAGAPLPSGEVQGDQWLKVRWNLTLVGVQVDDIEVRVRFMDPNNTPIREFKEIIVASNALQSGVNALRTPLAGGAFDFSPTGLNVADGWYNVQVCARDLDLPGVPPGPKGSTYGWFCDLEQHAILVDREPPGARLIKPANGAMVSGKEYLLVGKAWDPWWAEDDPVLQYGQVTATRFDYCAFSNYQTELKFCGPDDRSWIKIADGAPTPGVPYQWEAKLDSTQLPDDHGAIRFCATDLVGLTNCTATIRPWPNANRGWWTNPVFVVNRFSVFLRPGWNLVSTPLMLYDDDMDAAMFHLKDNVKAVWAVENKNAGWPNLYEWTKWVPGDAMKFKHGQGYWINMKTSAMLTFVGSFKNVGASNPPEYRVFEGWNLIGYTHWGQPATNWHWIGDKKVVDYLGITLSPSVNALWRYDAMSEQYIPTYFWDLMVKGAGYWLGLAEGGNINP